MSLVDFHHEPRPLNLPTRCGIQRTHEIDAKAKDAKMDPRIDALSRRHRWHLFRQYKCMSDELMDVDAVTSPPVTVRNLAVPRLRKCPFDIDTIDWRRARKLGQGADGCVYRVCFGDRGPFALKLVCFYFSSLFFPLFILLDTAHMRSSTSTT